MFLSPLIGDAACSLSWLTSVPPTSSGHQHRDRGLAQDRLCDATEHPLAQVRVAISTHDDEIGAESGSLRQQKAADVFSARRKASYLNLRPVMRQVARNVCPRLLAITRVTLMVDDQNLDRLAPRK